MFYELFKVPKPFQALNNKKLSNSYSFAYLNINISLNPPFTSLFSQSTISAAIMAIWARLSSNYGLDLANWPDRQRGRETDRQRDRHKSPQEFQLDSFRILILISFLFMFSLFSNLCVLCVCCGCCWPSTGEWGHHQLLLLPMLASQRVAIKPS